MRENLKRTQKISRCQRNHWLSSEGCRYVELSNAKKTSTSRKIVPQECTRFGIPKSVKCQGNLKRLYMRKRDTEITSPEK